MSAGSANADSDDNEDTNFSDDDDDSDNYRDDDSSDDDDDSDNYRDDDSLDDDDDSDNYRDDDSLDDDDDSDNYRDDDSLDDDDDSDNYQDDDSSDDDSYEMETSEITDYISYSYREEETDDKSNTDDNTAENQRGNHLASTYSSGKNNNEKKIEQSVRDNDKKDDANSDDSDDRKDSSDNINTDSDDSVKDNPANTASSSTNSPTRGPSTQITTNIPVTITTITTENSDNPDTGTTSNSANKDDSSTDLSPFSSSTDSSNTSQTTNPAINNDYESNVSVNVSSTVTEDANFLKDFRDSTEAHDNVELKDYSFASLVKGQEAIFEFRLEGNNIVSISFIPEVSGGQVKTVVEILKNTSTLINEAPPGVVYKNFNIWVGDAQFSPYMTNDAKVNFKVEKDWFLSNNIDHESIVLYGHVNGWNPLITEKTGEDDTYVYYTAHTPVFSVFAIVSMDYEPYKLDKDQAVSTIGGTAAASGGMDEIPHYNTYRNVALLLVSLLVAGVVGMTGLKYMARPGNEDKQGEHDSIQFKK